MPRYPMLALVLVAACGRAEPGRRPASREIAQADSAAAAADSSSAEEQDRPCFAANLGLPCK